MIKLVTISRISKEKGFERMLLLEEVLHFSGVQFVWDCYGKCETPYEKKIVSQFRYINFKGITPTPTETVKQYDYLVQLSDTEGFAYSIYEALSQKVPVIATDFPAIHETVKDGINGHILKMDLSDFTIKRLLNIPVIKTFKEKSTEKDWINFITMANKQKPAQKAKQTNQENKPKSGDVTVEVTRRYHDMELDQTLREGHLLKVSTERAKQLQKAAVAKVVELADIVIEDTEEVSA